MTFRTSPVSRRSHGTMAALAVACAAALLTGCAAPTPWRDGVPAASAAPRIQVPPTNVGTWVDLGYVRAPWLTGDAPVPVSGAAAPTRITGLRREDGRWLAIIIAQVAPQGGGACPSPNNLHVADAGTRADGCLRVRRDADFDRWLERQHSVLYQWLQGQQWSSRPRAWVGYRLPAAGDGRTMEALALLDPVLIEPATRNNDDFLAAGQPGQRWAQAFAAATRAAAGGVLNLPPFPFAPQLALPVPPAPPAVAAPLARATQVVPTPRPSAPAPRRDRE